jgi:hypothetical protein
MSSIILLTEMEVFRCWGFVGTGRIAGKGVKATAFCPVYRPLWITDSPHLSPVLLLLPGTTGTTTVVLVLAVGSCIIGLLYY